MSAQPERVEWNRRNINCWSRARLTTDSLIQPPQFTFQRQRIIKEKSITNKLARIMAKRNRLQNSRIKVACPIRSKLTLALIIFSKMEVRRRDILRMMRIVRGM